jgi:hypothetical protein
MDFNVQNRSDRFYVRSSDLGAMGALTRRLAIAVGSQDAWKPLDASPAGVRESTSYSIGRLSITSGPTPR